MARMIPLLPCGDLDEALAFYGALGFEVTYRQYRPYPCAGFQRGPLDLQVYGMPDWDPMLSHSTCIVLVDDTEALWREWADGLRGRYGKIPVKGLPRMTRPRRRANADGASGFSLVDPSGNWVRVFGEGPGEAAATTPLGRALDNAVVLADSKGDPVQALKILSAAVRRADETSSTDDRDAALSFVAELQERLGDDDAAAATRARLPAQP